MKRIIAVVISLLMITTGSFAAIPGISGIVPEADIEVSAASYPALKTMNYKATGDQRKDMVGFAKTQIGYTEKGSNQTYFGAWYGMNGQPWCAMFICWCAAKSGVPTSVVPKIANADRGWAKKQKVYYKSKQWGGTYTPKAGDLIYFSWKVKDYADHIGMVSGTGKVNGVTYVYTIEGNKHDKVKTGSYAINNKYILGYASPKYGSKGVTTAATTAAPKFTITYNANGGQNAPAAQTKENNKTLVLQKGTPTRVGFSFLGWAEAANATAVQYNPGGNFTANKSVTLFAVWKDNTYQVKITKDGGLPKRTGPGLNYEQKGTLAKDSTVTVVETKDGWGKLSDGYWIMLSFTVQVTKPTTTTAPTTKATTKATTASGMKTVGVYKITGDLYKREGPAKTYKQKGVLKKGSKVTVVEIKNGWGKMTDGTWSSMKYMKKIADPTTKPVTTAKPAPAPAPTTKAPVSVSTNKEFTVKVNASAGLNMRSGPGTSYKKKGTLSNKKKVTIKTVKGGWGQIKSNNYWIKLSYTKITSGYKVKVTMTNLHMRKGPSKKKKSVGYIKPGTYEIVKLSGNGAWGKLKTNGRWIMLMYTTRV